MKFCVHCGREVLDDAIICPGCGCSVQYGNNGNAQSNGNVHNQGMPQSDSYSGMSVAGLILAFLEPLIGLILSIIAHGEAKKTGSGKSLSMSKAGIIISAVFLGIVAAVVLIWIILFIVNVVIWI